MMKIVCFAACIIAIVLVDSLPTGEVDAVVPEASQELLQNERSVHSVYHPPAKVCHSKCGNDINKCGWKKCNGCSACSVFSATCRPFCGKNKKHTWEKKCKWKRCKGCDDCKPKIVTYHHSTRHGDPMKSKPKIVTYHHSTRHGDPMKSKELLQNERSVHSVYHPPAKVC